MLAVAFYEIVLAVHVMAVVVAFGVTFAYPIMFAVAARQDPRSLPLLHRIEYTIERWLINPGLLVVVVAGVYLASKLHFWSAFFVQWGIGAAVVIGALVGSVMIPTAKRAQATAERDLAGTAERGLAATAEQGLASTASESDTPAMSQEYRSLTRRLTIVGSALSLLVLVTIYFMITHTGA